MARPSKDVPSIPRAPSRPSALIQAPVCPELEIPTRLQECEASAVELMDVISALEGRLLPVLGGDVQGYAVDPEPAKTVIGGRISTNTAMLRSAANRVRQITDYLAV